MEVCLRDARHLAPIILALVIPSVAAAQGSHGYVFVGATTIPGEPRYTYWQGTYVHAGGGVEGGIGKRFTVGGEIGALISVAEIYGRNGAFLSLGPGFHLVARSGRKLDPFISGGVSLLVSRGAGILFYYGGGTNYWFRDRIGLRVEFRDHVWSPEGTALHFAGVRIGLSFR
jgi:hypothetical protein